jgi:hypothetical protein
LLPESSPTCAAAAAEFEEKEPGRLDTTSTLGSTPRSSFSSAPAPAVTLALALCALAARARDEPDAEAGRCDGEGSDSDRDEVAAAGEEGASALGEAAVCASARSCCLILRSSTAGDSRPRLEGAGDWIGLRAAAAEAASSPCACA